MKDLNAWGQWDDDGPYFVTAVCSLEEARDFLESCCGDCGRDEPYAAVPVRQHATVRMMHDCCFEDCHDPRCPNRHAETVYEFRLEENEGFWMEIDDD